MGPGQEQKRKADQTLRLIRNYNRPDGVTDELLDSQGQIRPAWRSFVDFFAGLSGDSIERRFSRGDQYLRDAGVFFRQYDETGSAERVWPLSHIPVILEESDWRDIEVGLKQRADLLEMVMQDLYGPMRLISDGHLPGELIGKSKGWLRQMVGTQPRNGHFLNFLAFEIGRGPDGTWWVLGDRSEAPSGAGFALENRVATTHVFPDFYRRAHVQRLAGFFGRFKDHLFEASRDQDFGVAILTPGRLNDGYFEHAYIARYLGFMLLEGEDITVRNGEAVVRTVDGIRPLSVLWRRMDSAFVDPLELNSKSMIGTPGLANVVRQGKLNMINCLGSGFLENRSMLAFLPRICQALRSEELLMPNIATWWCGQSEERDYALSKENDMMFGSALSTHLPFERNEMSSILDGEAGNALRGCILADGASYVAQEKVKLSTTPVFEDNALHARAMTIRVFLARTAQGWEVMPGGYARIGKETDQTVLALQGGGKVADVWIKCEDKVDAVSLNTTEREDYVRKMPEVLPTRAADNLFWLGRYIERAELCVRMTRAYHSRLDENDDYDAPLLKFFASYLKVFNIDPKEAIGDTVCNALLSAMGSAGHLRDRFSTDGWMALKDLSDTAEDFRKTVEAGDDAADACQILLRKISGFSGLVHESMYHYTGWRFMKIGRALERAGLMASAMDHFIQRKAPVGALDIPVDIGDSMMTHRRRYVVTTSRETVVDLLVLDSCNPRSIVYQLNECREHLAFLPHENDLTSASDLSRAVLKLYSDVAVKKPHQVTRAFLQELGNDIYAVCNMISAQYLK